MGCAVNYQFVIIWRTVAVRLGREPDFGIPFSPGNKISIEPQNQDVINMGSGHKKRRFLEDKQC